MYNICNYGNFLFFPFLAIATTQIKLHKVAYKGFVLWSTILRFLVGWFFKTKGKLPESNNTYIIIANHASYADIFLTPSLLPKFPSVFLGKSEILSYPLINLYFKSFNIPVFRGNKTKAAKSLIIARKKLEKGWSLIIFPEGGIPDGNRPNMIPFKDGAFRLAKETNTPILPITYVNNYKLFTDPSDILGSCRPGFSKVIIHPVISTKEIKEMSIEELKKKSFELINSGLKK